MELKIDATSLPLLISALSLGVSVVAATSAWLMYRHKKKFDVKTIMPLLNAKIGVKGVSIGQADYILDIINIGPGLAKDIQVKISPDPLLLSNKIKCLDLGSSDDAHFNIGDICKYKDSQKIIITLSYKDVLDNPQQPRHQTFDLKEVEEQALDLHGFPS